MKFKETVTVRDSYYQSYRKLKPNDDINISIYISIISLYVKYLVKLILLGRTVRLPSKLGHIAIKGNERKARIEKEGIRGLPIDWKSTNEYWKEHPEEKEKKKVIYFYNEHTNGVTFRVCWFKKEVNFKNKDKYYFRFTRLNKRDSAKMINSGQDFMMSNK